MTIPRPRRTPKMLGSSSDWFTMAGGPGPTTGHIGGDASTTSSGGHAVAVSYCGLTAAVLSGVPHGLQGKASKAA